MSYLQREPLDETNFPLFANLQQLFRFVPNFFRAQTMRPDLIEAEAQLMSTLIVKECALSRREKEYIFLVCSGANLSTYCVTAHCEIVRMLGIQGPEPEQIAVDYAVSDLPLEVKALLGFALKLNNTPAKIGESDIAALRTYGYSDAQILEAVVVVGFAKFANYIGFGLGTVPDFDPAKVLAAQRVTRPGANIRF